MIAKFDGANAQNEHYQALSELLGRLDAEQLAVLARACNGWSVGIDEWNCDGEFEAAVRYFARSDDALCAEVALRLVLIGQKQERQHWRGSPVHSRGFAPLVAASQSEATLCKLLSLFGTSSGTEELFACWIQESVLRGRDFQKVYQVEEFWQSLRVGGHPLAHLPLALDPLESAVKQVVADRDKRFSVSGADALPRLHRRPRTHDSRREFVEKATRDGTAAVVRSWEEGSDGESECRLFVFDSPVDPDEVDEHFLLGLPLRRMEGVKRPKLEKIAPDQALKVLFEAAVIGGDHSSGREGAYGRRDLWQSIAGITRAEDAAIPALAKTASAWHWYEFRAGCDWYVGYEVGILALSPDGKEVTVLAATDTVPVS